MKQFLLFSLIAISLISCQKSMVIADTPCREIPFQNVYLREFGLYLQDDKPYRITRYYTACSDEWLNMPDSAKDDIHTFSVMNAHGQFNGKIRTGRYSVPDEEGESHAIELVFPWKAYGHPQLGVVFDWVDFQYLPITYEVEELRADQFILSRLINGKKYYLEFSRQFSN
jgi:hypothetical protein